MIQPIDLNAIGEEVERRIPKECKTCLESIYCDDAEKNVICKQWKPDFNLFQDKWEEVTKEMNISI